MNNCKGNKNFVYRLYRVEHFLYKKQIILVPNIIKLLIRILFYAVIPPELEVGKNVLFGYNGLGIVIHPKCRIGDNVIICQHVTLGGYRGSGVPTIGNNVFIGAGAKIIGDVKIGDNARIGANAVVLKNVPDNTTAIGIPARIIIHS